MARRRRRARARASRLAFGGGDNPALPRMCHAMRSAPAGWCEAIVTGARDVPRRHGSNRCFVPLSRSQSQTLDHVRRPLGVDRPRFRCIARPRTPLALILRRCASEVRMRSAAPNSVSDRRERQVQESPSDWQSAAPWQIRVHKTRVFMFFTEPSHSTARAGRMSRAESRAYHDTAVSGALPEEALRGFERV